MSIDSLQFFIFLPTVVILYRILPHSVRWLLLLIGSYVFYAFYNPQLVVVLLLVTLVSYIFGRCADSAYEGAVKKIFTAIPILTSLGTLFVYKYFNTAYRGVTKIFSFLNLDDINLDLVVPLGLSFFTLRTISYAIDIYKNNISAERHIGYFALYISFFPTLIAGPLERSEELIEQFRDKTPITPYDTVYGMKMLAVGLFKILAVVRPISVLVDNVFAGVNSADVNLNNGFTVLIAAVMFFFQFYCEFSGYCDIATGCAAMLGVKLRRNFKAPYLALNVRELHSSWNITVNDFFRDYVYKPMTPDGSSSFRAYFNLGIVYLLVGIWYGSGITFIIFGLAHYFARLVSELVENKRTANTVKRKANGSMGSTALKIFAMFAFSCVTLMLFRASNLTNFKNMLIKLFTGWNGVNVIMSINATGISLLSFITVIISIAVVVILDRQITLSDEINRDSGLRPERAQTYITLCWAIAIAWLAFLAMGAVNAYEYFIF